jgi:hypothetical protein
MKTKRKTKPVARKKRQTRTNTLSQIAAAKTPTERWQKAFGRMDTPATRLTERWSFLSKLSDYRTNPTHAKQLANLDPAHGNPASAYNRIYDDAVRDATDLFRVPLLEGNASFFRQFADEMEQALTWSGPQHLEAAAALATEQHKTIHTDGKLAPLSNTSTANIIAAHKWPQQQKLSTKAQLNRADLRENAAVAALRNVKRIRARLGLKHRDK